MLVEPPPPLLSPFGSYPNPLQLTDADRSTFHPVVQFPTPPRVLDLTVPGTHRQLATEEERQVSQAGQVVAARPAILPHPYTIGRYDENRPGLYESELFEHTDHAIDGFAGQRTVHVGMDLDGPVGTPVHAFCAGSIHAVGYNPELGDYGNVVVLRHELSSLSCKNRHVYALYGHLSNNSIQDKTVGQCVAPGEVIGAVGDIHENGGWFIPHVHFQLSVKPPATHDMPGVVSLADRPKALMEYPDPRWVLGALY